MAPKRLPLSFPEFEPKGRHAILRTAEEIKAEENTQEVKPNEVTADPPKNQNPETQESKNERSNETPIKQTNEQLNGRPLEPTVERTKVRHSFDIYQDQLLTLTELQTKVFRATGRKPRISDMVQEALDAYLSNNKRKDIRTNERSNGE